MTADREVVREGENQKSGFSLFGRKEVASKQVSRPPGVHSHSMSRTASMSSSAAPGDDDLPPRTTNDSATSTDEKANIPKHAGFDFQAIKDVIGEEGLDVEKNPAPPGLGGPGVEPLPTLALARPPRLLERSEPAPPLTKSPSGSESPDTPTPPIVQLPRKDAADLSSTFSSSLSLGGLPQDKNPSTSSPTPYPSRGTSTEPYQQTPAHSDGSTLSFGSAGGDIWASGATPSPDTQLTFGRADGTILGGSSNPHSPPTSYGFNNGSANGRETNAFAATPTLTFGGADGSISHATEDPWKPKPITSERKRYTPNPWDS